MAIDLGTRIGPYQVTAVIGEGGMGKVWRAHHTALNRDLALKVLPDERLTFDKASSRPIERVWLRGDSDCVCARLNSRLYGSPCPTTFDGWLGNSAPDARDASA